MTRRLLALHLAPGSGVDENMAATPLEQAVLTADPTDPVFQVWGDTLTEAGDPRGELVALTLTTPQGARLKALTRLLATNEQHWCPHCLHDEQLRLTWRNGFVDEVTFAAAVNEESPPTGYNGPDDESGDEHDDQVPCGRALRTLLGLPTARRVTALRLTCRIDAEGNHGCWGNHDGFVAHLLTHDLPWLTRLHFDASLLSGGEAAPELSFQRFGFMHDAEVTVGDLSALWARAPRLEHLVLAQPVGFTLGTIVAPNLQSLLVGSHEANAAIVKGTLPQLRSLSVRVKSAKDVAAIVTSASLASVRHLTLVFDELSEGEPDGAADIDALLSGTWLHQLESLDLGGLSAQPAAWQKLVAAAPRFKALRELSLTTWAVDEEQKSELAAHEEWRAHFGQPLLALRTLPHGRALEQAFPVRWLTSTMDSFDGSSELTEGFVPGCLLGEEGYGEHRPPHERPTAKTATPTSEKTKAPTKAAQAARPTKMKARKATSSATTTKAKRSRAKAAAKAPTKRSTAVKHAKKKR